LALKLLESLNSNMTHIKIPRNNNFDAIRLLLAVTVFVVHAAGLTGLETFKVVASYLNSTFAVYSFFVVSGFLIFMSYENTDSNLSFFSKRFFRIFPGYAFVILFVAISFGLISTYSYNVYFSYDWLKYLFFNLITLNFLESTLPGVFSTNTVQSVNGALWTIKIEVMFYLSVPIISLFFKRNKISTILIILFLISIGYYEGLRYLADIKDDSLYLLLAKQLPGQLSFFVVGASIYYYFSHFSKYAHAYLVLGVILFILYSKFEIWFILSIAIGLLVIYFATIFRYCGNFGKFGDLSFGIYIWHFPIIQVFINFNFFKLSPFFSTVSLILTVLLFSVFSWNFIEKPFLRKKSHYIYAQKEKNG